MRNITLTNYYYFLLIDKNSEGLGIFLEDLFSSHPYYSPGRPGGFDDVPAGPVFSPFVS
jgi:hypothetical protein